MTQDIMNQMQHFLLIIILVRKKLILKVIKINHIKNFHLNKKNKLMYLVNIIMVNNIHGLVNNKKILMK